MFGGSDPFAGQYWTGMQDACYNEHLSRRVICEISREIAPDLFDQDRLAYRWQVPLYHEEKHVIIRDYLAENEVDIVDFYRQYLPKLRAELGRDPIITVTNPHVKQEKEQHGSYGPTKRAMTLDDIAHLRKFVEKSDKFTYELNQAVTCQLAWNFVVTSGDDGPEIIMIEPQNDKVVEPGSGIYSIDRRCGLLL